MPRHDQPDVVVVGAGMAGAAISYVLSRAGAKVVCLEQGPAVHPTDHPTFTDDWEYGLRRDWAFEPNIRNQPHDFPVVTNGTFQPYLYNAVGGSTNHYSAFWHRLKPVDFRKGTEHGLEGTIDWPLTYEDLAPFYDRNDADVGVSGLPGDAAYPPRPGAPRLPLVRHGDYYDLVTHGMDQLGVHWWPADNAILTEDRGDRLACNTCGMCNFGCPRGSLGTATQAYVKPALALGLDLRPEARVTRISTGADGAADGVEYVDLRTGTGHRVDAPLVVLAANGIGSPRTLLMSTSRRHPHGLGNDTDHVGRHFMTHGYRLGDMWFDRSTAHYKGPFGAGPYCQEWYDTDLSRGFVNGITITFGGAWGPASSALGATTGRSPAPWGEGHHAAFEERFDRHVFCAIQADDLPVPTNRVTLDPTATDSSGLPAANVHYDLHPNTRALLEFGSDRLQEIATAAGARGLDLQPMDDSFSQPGWHLMGTCRMSDSPEEGVVDAWNRVWDTPGLVVCDGSSMVTGGAGNPTSTIGALALRCADKLVADMGRRVEAPAH
ncbi:GMC family oxidoreductase [Geodermatophilus sp. DSM 44513]|uniref:GMC family oxidoreductase n=1 Tax=Geodermatophilus sp. DSM 44513 TaxID=1528104 RepID=UPI001275C2F5|nr:GMC family oxidoreductase [Geodermatophilus sp. DSM 44513]WNV75071.1 GMC family oxidoreductase [Geodermatophilus sp. DSM 44513]